MIVLRSESNGNCLYEDGVTGQITPERYDTMANGSEQEQAELWQELELHCRAHQWTG